MSEQDAGQSGDVGETALEKAAAAGTLPGVVEENAEADRGDDHSGTGDDEEGTNILGGALRNVLGHHEDT